jgi:hypothetical protein
MTAPGRPPHGGIEEQSFDGVVESDARRAKPRALPGLRGGMIPFEDAQSGGSQRIAVGESIESGAEHDVRANSALKHGRGELIFGVAAAGGDRDREWIAEDPRLIEKLMLRSPDGDTLGGPAGRCVLDG